MSTPPQSAMDWIAGDDTGCSSRAIWAHMSGAKRRVSASDYPHDPSDFGRCYRLLALVPEWRPRIAEMAVYGPHWAALVGVWDDLEAMYETALDTVGPYGRAQELYDCMTTLLYPKATP